MKRRPRPNRIRDLVGVQKQVLAKVARKADVLGAMVGLKLSGGQPTGAVGITFLVRRKLPLQALRSGEKIPARVVVDGTAAATDVLEWPAMAEQSLATASIINDAHTQGTLTCFARSARGHFGLSCAHCLSGPDRNPATPTLVSMYSPELDRYLPAGESHLAVYSPGLGAPGDFGYLDCGLFRLGDQALLQRAAGATPITAVDDVETLVGKRLTATSSLRAPGTSDPRRAATVIAVNVEALAERCDVVLLADAPGTFPGDSGMLWFDEGRAAAIHARGEVMPSLVGSRLVTAMSARRASGILGIELAIG